MKKVLAFVILLAMSLRVFALTVNVNGTDYDVNYYPVPFKNYQTLFENQVWWGNQSLARDFADAVKYQLGIVNPAGNDGPYFAFSYNSNTDIVGGCYYNSANGAQCTTNLTSGGAHGYAVAQPIANKLAYAVDNQNNIYSVDFANGATCLIGNAGSIAIISTMESLALSPSGVLYAVTTSGDLYSIDKDTAASTLIGNTGHNMAGLDFSGATLLGTQWVPGQTPAAVYEINTSTGGATLVQTSSAISGGALFQSAALAVENANTVQLLAYQDISNRNQGVLAAMDLSSGAATIAGATVNDVYAMDYLGDGHLYALGRDGAMYRVNPATGAMTSIGDTGNQVWTGMTAAELIPVTARVNGGNG
ncbi:MAG TPA: hypothetical protein P5330_12840, partial [Candidatus Competibacteraceae bacterium]|nr:hypothetical protein [Candidatus Competibacteraceae bacterium]